MTALTEYIKSEYVGGPLDGDKRRATSYAEYYAAADATEAHRYHADNGCMQYGGIVPSASAPELRPLRVGVER